jgi:nitrogen-specific signal transduction histidine kinase
MTLKSAIAIVTDDLTERNALPSIHSVSKKVSEIATEVISENLSRFICNFESVLDRADASDSRLIIDQVELNLVVNAQGGVELIGKVSAGMAASIKLTLKRRPEQQGRERA